MRHGKHQTNHYQPKRQTQIYGLHRRDDVRLERFPLQKPGGDDEREGVDRIQNEDIYGHLRYRVRRLFLRGNPQVEQVVGVVKERSVEAEAVDSNGESSTYRLWGKTLTGLL